MSLPTEKAPALHWFDEGDGYQHAHTDEKCNGFNEVADFIVTDERTDVTVMLPGKLSPELAREIAEECYAKALHVLDAAPCELCGNAPALHRFGDPDDPSMACVGCFERIRSHQA